MKITHRKLIHIEPSLAAIAPLSPPPELKGRYIFSKAVDAVGEALRKYTELDTEILVRFADKDEKQRPIIKTTADGLEYQMSDKIKEECRKERKALLDMEIELIGLRAVTHAELGKCPITIEMMAPLIGNLIVDIEPE